MVQMAGDSWLDTCPVGYAMRRSARRTLREFDEMRHRRIGIFVAFVHIDRLPVFADEPLIPQDAALALRRDDHFAGERLEFVEAARPDNQLNPPGNLHYSRQSDI